MSGLAYHDYISMALDIGVKILGRYDKMAIMSYDIHRFIIWKAISGEIVIEEIYNHNRQSAHMHSLDDLSAYIIQKLKL